LFCHCGDLTFFAGFPMTGVFWALFINRFCPMSIMSMIGHAQILMGIVVTMALLKLVDEDKSSFIPMSLRGNN